MVLFPCLFIYFLLRFTLINNCMLYNYVIVDYTTILNKDYADDNTPLSTHCK